MGYLQEVDRWLDMLLTDLADEKISFEEMKRDIRSRVLESYKNGLKAGGQSPAPRESRSPRPFNRAQH
jgi:hypothetical protein